MGLLNRVKRVKNRPFMEAVAAGAAMVAYADGIVRPEETAKLLDFIRLDETLSVFDPSDVLIAFEKNIEVFDFDPRLGREKALKSLREIERGGEEAKLVVLVCIAIGAADGEFSLAQRRCIRDMCGVLGLDPDRFDLDGPPPEWRVPNRPLPAPAPEKKRRLPRGDVPEWMREPPVVPPKPVPTPADVGKRGAKGKKVEDADMPEWMRHPPDPPPKPLPKENERSPGTSAKDRPDDSSMPEWMRHPPESPPPRDGESDAPSDSDPDAAVPEWMRRAGGRSPRTSGRRRKREK